MENKISKEQILKNLEHPKELEKMYRLDKSEFKKNFQSIYEENKGSRLVQFWNERLNYSEEINWGERKNIYAVIIAAIIAGILMKFPKIANVTEEFYYARNSGFIVIPALAGYFMWKNNMKQKMMIAISSIILLSVIYMNIILTNYNVNTYTLSCIHIVLFLWSILGIAYVGGIKNDVEKRLNFLKYNGDLVVMSGLICIAGGILSGLTIGLFGLIGINIETFYINNIAIVGLSMVPIIATYLTQSNPQLVGKVSTVIAKLFSPIVLVTMIIYLTAIIITGKDPYNDREFLLLFNALIIGVIAIIFFSIAGTGASKTKAELSILFLLSIITFIISSIALSAILFRITEFGITPNRMTVLGSNAIMLTHLFILTIQLYKVLIRNKETSIIGESISKYLPVYAIWTIIVCFIFPYLF